MVFSLPDPFGELDSLPRLGMAGLFVLLAALISWLGGADIEQDILVAAGRSFLQLILIGYALNLIFAQNHPLLTLLILLVMMSIAALNAGQRAQKTPHARQIAAVAIGFGGSLTISLLLILGVFRFVPQDIIPIGGMIIGNSMTTAILTITRLTENFEAELPQIEGRLALGANHWQAFLPEFQNGLRSAMLPIVETTKTVGLIQLPGAMTGMILAGASPVQAVQLQIIVMYMLMGAAAFTGLSAGYLTFREFFAPKLTYTRTKT